MGKSLKKDQFSAHPVKIIISNVALSQKIAPGLMWGACPISEFFSNFPYVLIFLQIFFLVFWSKKNGRLLKSILSFFLALTQKSTHTSSESSFTHSPGCAHSLDAGKNWTFFWIFRKSDLIHPFWFRFKDFFTGSFWGP